MFKDLTPIGIFLDFVLGLSFAFIITIFVSVCASGLENNKNKGKTKEEQEIIVLTQESALHEIVTSPEKDLIHILNILDIKYPDIVYAQAILETGHFTSKVCKEYNNLFGLYDSKNNCYYKFNHWIDSCIAYKNMIQNQYEGGDYYTFLKNLPYATDTLYINKIKNIQNERHNNKN